MDAYYSKKIEQFRSLAEEFHAESDRGCAVLVLCVLEDALRDLIRAVLPEPLPKLGRLAPPGSITTSLETAVQLGLLTDHQATAFKDLAGIRNQFAHGALSGLNFDDPDIAKMVSRCRSAVILPDDMSVREELNDQSNRTYFLMLAGIMWLLLIMKRPNVKSLPSAVEIDVTKLSEQQVTLLRSMRPSE